MGRADTKEESLTLRVSQQFKEALRQAAEREHRSMANMVEYLVLDYYARNKLPVFTARKNDEGK